MGRQEVGFQVEGTNPIKCKTAVANNSEAMEADTISKNGRSLKSQTSRVNIIIGGF